MLSNKALSIKGFVGHIFMRNHAAHAVRDEDVARRKCAIYPRKFS